VPRGDFHHQILKGKFNFNIAIEIGNVWRALKMSFVSFTLSSDVQNNPIRVQNSKFQSSKILQSNVTKWIMPKSSKRNTLKIQNSFSSQSHFRSF